MIKCAFHQVLQAPNYILKPVFHFKRTVPKRIRNVFKFLECWLVSTSVVRQKVDLRWTFYFDTRIHPEVRGFINLFSICACSPVRFGTIRAKWKTSFTLEVENGLKKETGASGRKTHDFRRWLTLFTCRESEPRSQRWKALALTTASPKSHNCMACCRLNIL
jgi:hypothetical protein